MIIPESFMLFGHVINVKSIVDLMYSRGVYGQANYANNQIYIQLSNESNPIPITVVEETFIHEMVHQILNQMNEKYSELNQDESFVEGFAQLLHQALTTQEGNISIDERSTKSHIQKNSSTAK